MGNAAEKIFHIITGFVTETALRSKIEDIPPVSFIHTFFMEVRQVHAGVPSCTAFLGVFEDVFGLVLVAVTCRPAVELTAGTAAELEQLFPVSFEEVQDSCDDFILFGFGIPERGTVDVDV